MYRESAKTGDEEVLYTGASGVSPVILGSLLIGPLFLVGIGALTNAMGTMALAALPFFAAFAILLGLRRTTVITTHALRSKSFFRTRVFPLETIARLVVPHAQAAALAATSDSKLSASVLVYDVQGAWFALPSAVPTNLLQRIVASALPGAVKRAEDLIASGGRYRDADDFSAIDAENLHGKAIGFTVTPKTAKLDAIASINADGRVALTDGSSFMIAAQDLVLSELLKRRGVSIQVPMALDLLVRP